MATSMYGYDVKSIHDPFVAVAEEATGRFEKLLLPGASMVNIIRILRYIPSFFPGASSHKSPARVRNLTERAMGITMEFTQTKLKEGTATPSLISNFLEKKETVGATEEEERSIENLAFTIYGAAPDTTISATRTFYYCMLVNPDIQRKAHNEIDRVIGNDRLPTFEDRGSLPCLEAVYREVMRFSPPLLLSVPHGLIEDDYYKGYFENITLHLLFNT